MCTLFLVLLLCNKAGAQDVPYKHLIFLEAGGLAGIGSVNYQYDMSLSNDFSLGFRGGFGTVHLKDYRLKFNPDLIFPFSIQVLYGKIHRAEMGVGQTISNFQTANLRRNPIHTRTTNFNTTFTLGYRFDHHKMRLFYRIAYTPYIEKNKHYKHWGAISIGYAFK
ncbi:MAG: hypothetical protein LBH22_06595 [Bacteroidales bacterium]|jgi:hypothetical protein|nr:hypothetical protein [Bacteroidales bacterium]